MPIIILSQCFQRFSSVILETTLREILLFLIYRRENWDFEKVNINAFPSFTQKLGFDPKFSHPGLVFFLLSHSTTLDFITCSVPVLSSPFLRLLFCYPEKYWITEYYLKNTVTFKKIGPLFFSFMFLKDYFLEQVYIHNKIKRKV